MNIGSLLLGIFALVAGLSTGAVNLILTGPEGIISINSFLSAAIILVSIIALLNGLAPDKEKW